MASKPTEMCVVEKSGAREYKVLFFSSPSSFPCEHFVRVLRLLVFLSLSLSAVTRSGGSPSLVVDVWRRKGGGRTSRAVAPQNRAQFNRAARDARERVGTISARLSRGKWMCSRESTATFEMRRGRGWVVDDEASTKRHGTKVVGPFFFPFFLSFLRKTFGCETFRFDQ